MSYKIVVENNEVGLAGFCLALPFDCDGNSLVGLHPDRSVAILHVARNASNNVDYSTESAKLIPANPTGFEVKDANGNSVLCLRSYRAVFYQGNHHVGHGESVVVIQGVKDVNCLINGINYSAQGQDVPDLGYSAPNNQLFAWKGELLANNNLIRRVSAASVEMDPSGPSLNRLSASGPVEGPSGQGILSWIITQANGWLIMNGGLYEPSRMQALGQLTVKDVRRQTDIQLFGTNPHGIAQAANARGIVVVGAGTFAHVPANTLLNQVCEASFADDGLTRELRRIANLVLTDRTLHGGKSKDSRLKNEDSRLFEGLAVWGLNYRVQPKIPLL